MIVVDLVTIDQFYLISTICFGDNKFPAPKNLIYLVTVKIFNNNKKLMDILIRLFHILL